MDLLSSSHNEDDNNNNNAPQNECRNSALERACRVFGFHFEDDYDIDAEVQRAMRSDFSLHGGTSDEDENPISVENSSVNASHQARIAHQKLEQ